MSEEFIEQFNVKCANFLQWKLIPTHSNSLLFKDLNGYEYYTHKLNFNSDWNWINKLIDKIRSLYWRFDIVHHPSVSRTNEITITIWQKYPGGGDHTIVEFTNENNMLVHIQAIDKFIDWFNENK